MLPIQQKLIRYNFNAGGNNVKYIVIHDTGNPNAGAYNHFLYFNGGNRGASAHYFVDDSNIIQLVRDGDRAWHCGDGRGRYGISNSNSIGIEICLPGNREKTIAHTVDLTAYLMKKHNVARSNLIRHYDASRKSCPNTMRANNWAAWHEFKARVHEKLSGEVAPVKGAIGEVIVTANILNVRLNADANSPKLGEISKNHRRPVFAQVGDWLEIRYSGRPAYIHAGYVDYIKFEEEIELKREELDKILDERDRQLENKVLRKVSALIRPGAVKDHWVEEDFKELNEYLESKGVPRITSETHNDFCTRGEVIRMNNLVRKAIDK